MGVMVREVYEAFLEAGASKPVAAVAKAIPATDQLATQHDIAAVCQDISELRADFAAREPRLVKWSVAVVGLAVAAESFLDWMIK